MPATLPGRRHGGSDHRAHSRRGVAARRSARTPAAATPSQFGVRLRRRTTGSPTCALRCRENVADQHAAIRRAGRTRTSRRCRWAPQGKLPSGNQSSVESQLTAGTLQWPKPQPTVYKPDNSGVDDLWHAAINGRGRFVNAQSADEAEARHGPDPAGRRQPGRALAPGSASRAINFGVRTISSIAVVSSRAGAAA